MIDDLDRSLEAMLRAELPQPIAQQVGISFAPPDATFPPADLSLPAVDLFLYDLSENSELRRTDPVVERRGDHAFRHLPPARLDCAYLVTAWPSDTSTAKALDEHRILGEVALVLARHRTLPATYLQGRLQAQPQPPPVQRLADSRLGGTAEYWQALGGKPKPGLSLVVTLSLVTGAPPDDLGEYVKTPQTILQRWEEPSSPPAAPESPA